MNIKHIWTKHKLLAILLCVYFLAFIGLNVKQGIVATPVLQYGMFSGKQSLTDTATSYVFYINNEKINLSNYSFTERDVILTSLDKYLSHKENNLAVYNSFNGIMQKMHFYTNQTGFTNNVNESSFNNWYTQKLENILDVKIKSAEVYSQKFIWQKNKIILTDSAQKILSIVN
jgi:hypothetical protein